MILRCQAIVMVYPPPRFRGGRLMRARGLSFSFSLEVLHRHAFFRTRLRNAYFSTSSGNAFLEHLPGNAFLRTPLGNLSLERPPPWPPLGNLSSERISFRARPASARSYSELPGVTRNSLHDFSSPCFSPSFSNRSGTPLFRSSHRKTSQNGAQTLPKSNRKRVRNRSYVANAEK